MGSHDLQRVVFIVEALNNAIVIIRIHIISVSGVSVNSII